MIWAVIVALIGSSAVGPALVRRRPARVEAARATARALQQRLDYEVSVAPSDHAALAHAKERLTTSGGVLARARSRRQCQLAERVAQEGLDLLGR